MTWKFISAVAILIFLVAALFNFFPLKAFYQGTPETCVTESTNPFRKYLPTCVQLLPLWYLEATWRFTLCLVQVGNSISPSSQGAPFPQWKCTRTQAAKDCSWGYYRLWDSHPPKKLALCKCTNPRLYFMCTILQSSSNTKKLKKKPLGSETNKPLLLTNLFIYACDQVIPHDFTRHFSLCSLFPKQSQEKSTKPNAGSFRYFLKTIWAEMKKKKKNGNHMKLKVKAKSKAIHVFTGLWIQSNESYDKCTVQH